MENMGVPAIGPVVWKTTIRCEIHAKAMLADRPVAVASRVFRPRRPRGNDAEAETMTLLQSYEWGVSVSTVYIQ